MDDDARSAKPVSFGGDRQEETDCGERDERDECE